MEIIRQNPYHVIGILAGANQRTIVKQKTRINAFQKVGKSIEFDTDLNFNGNPDRTKEEVDKAFSNIEKNKNKLVYALFWFNNNNHIDEAALNYLQSGDAEKAEDIWEKIINKKKVTIKNITAFNNLGTLKLATAFANGSMDAKKLQQGILLKFKLLTSDYYSDFCSLVTDETYTVDQEKDIESFVNFLLDEFNKNKASVANKIFAIISSVHPKVESIVSEKLTEPLFYNIELKIEQSKKRRREDFGDSLQVGIDLYKDTKKDIVKLLDLLGETDLKYKSVADKLAKELLQSGIDYFKEFNEDEELDDGDLGKDVMELFEAAISVAIGKQTKERIIENINGLQEWIDQSDERKKQKKVDEDLKFVVNQIEWFQNLSETIENSDYLLSSCKPKLLNIKSALGVHDDLYIKISSAVVNNAQTMLISVINDAQENLSVQLVSLEELKVKIRKAIKVSEKLGKFDMFSELKKQCQKNHRALVSISFQIDSSIFKSSSSSKAGCYIATMAYGSYEHPQVLALRTFRDKTLSKSICGKIFIRLYYWLSPKLVKLLRGNALISSIIRKLLNQFIRHIK